MRQFVEREVIVPYRLYEYPADRLGGRSGHHHSDRSGHRLSATGYDLVVVTGCQSTNSLRSPRCRKIRARTTREEAMAECQELLISFGSRRTASSICRCVISSPPSPKTRYTQGD